MTVVIAGVTSGLLMAAVFSCAGPMLIFFMLKDTPKIFKERIGVTPGIPIMIGTVLVAYPIWGLIGAILGFVYGATTTNDSFSGAGSPNLTYSLMIVAVSVAIILPVAFVFRRVLAGLVAMTLVFVGIFGWLLPFLVG